MARRRLALRVAAEVISLSNPLQLLTSDKQELLEAQGFQVAELTGFDDHALPLYAHRPMGDKKRGDVVLRARVGNPESLDDGEATYLARKAFHGMFPWLPGKECLRRAFIDIRITGDGKAAEKGRKENGCRWCRKLAQSRRRSRPAIDTDTD